MTAPLTRLTAEGLDALTKQARARPRRRLNENLHTGEGDTVQRLYIAMEPGSYVRPHRHAADRFELFIALRGRLALLTFDDSGRVLSRDLLSPDGAVPAVEVPGAIWHTVVSLQPGSVFLEVKQGPYTPLSDKDFAAWAPPEGTPGATALEAWLQTADAGAPAPAMH